MLTSICFIRKNRGNPDDNLVKRRKVGKKKNCSPRDRLSIKGGKGGFKTGGEGSQVLPLQKGEPEKVLAMLKGE